jgi:capsular exopolysaccharide synthesis family protein
VLLGQVPLWAAVQEVPGVDGLSVLASGAVPPNPSELLSSPRTAEVLTPLHAEGHLVLVDSPPVLPVTDALVLAQHVDATLLVCAAGRTSKKEVARASELLQQVDAPLVGTVLNGVSASEGYGYSYTYYRDDGWQKEGLPDKPSARPEPANQ